MVLECWLWEGVGNQIALTSTDSKGMASDACRSAFAPGSVSWFFGWAELMWRAGAGVAQVRRGDPCCVVA